MSDQFGTRPGGEHDNPTGDPQDDPLPPVYDDDQEHVIEEAGFDDSSIAPDDTDAAAADIDAAGESSSDVSDAAPLPAFVPGWVGAVSGAGLALVAVQALVLVGIISQGLAIKGSGADLFHKIGHVVHNEVGSANGLMLVVAAVLAALPSLLGAPQQASHRRRQALTFGVGGVLAVLLVIATPLGVRTRIFVIEAGGQTVDAFTRLALTTYVATTLGTALVALGTCLGLSRYSRSVTPRS